MDLDLELSYESIGLGRCARGVRHQSDIEFGFGLIYHYKRLCLGLTLEWDRSGHILFNTRLEFSL